MQFFKAHKLVCAEVLMTVALIVFIALCVRGRVRDDVPLSDLKGPVLEQLAGAENMKEAGAMKLRSLYGLAENDYEGYVLVEAEQDPAIANPLEYAIKARKYIREKAGL